MPDKLPALMKLTASYCFLLFPLKPSVSTFPCVSFYYCGPILSPTLIYPKPLCEL